MSKIDQIEARIDRVRELFAVQYVALGPSIQKMQAAYEEVVIQEADLSPEEKSELYARLIRIKWLDKLRESEWRPTYLAL